MPFSRLPGCTIVIQRPADLNESTTKSHFIQNYIYLFRKNLPKNMLTFLAFVWSIIGLFFVAALEFRGSALAGYADGLFKGARGRFDSLYPDWQENMHLYESITDNGEYCFEITGKYFENLLSGQCKKCSYSALGQAFQP